MTLHLLPCGTSILDNLERGVQPPISATDVREMNRWANRAMGNGRAGVPVGTWKVSFVDDIGPYLPYVRSCQSPVKLSAEVASLHQHAAGCPLPDDQIVLLASDTPDGMLAALLNAARWSRPITVHTVPSLDNIAGGVVLLDDNPGEAVHVIRIPKLLPTSALDFDAALVHIAQAMVWAGLIHSPAGKPLALHLAGGFKATLPYLVVLAEYLKGAKGSDVKAFCLHEGHSRENPSPKPVEIRLRKVDLNADLAELAEAATGQLPDPSRLLDFAYKDVHGCAALTDLGKALRAIQHFMVSGQ